MALRIEEKIVGFGLVDNASSESSSSEVPPAALPNPKDMDPTATALETMSEALERQEELTGSTYKIKPPTLNHAIYVTINDIVLNEGTPYETRRPYEIFIASKNMENIEWMVALTRVMSAVFRKGGNLTFLVEELQAIFSPQGGYLKPGGVFMPSVVAEFGAVLKRHLVKLGLMEEDNLEPEQRAYLEEKIREVADAQPAFGQHARICWKCHHKAVIKVDGCDTCMNCGDSKCG